MWLCDNMLGYFANELTFSTKPFFSGTAASDMYSRLLLLKLLLFLEKILSVSIVHWGDADDVLKAEDDGHIICFDCKPVGEKPDTVCRRDIDSSKQEVMGPEFFMVVYLYCIKIFWRNVVSANLTMMMIYALVATIAICN